ncbi:unnamed protein product, partial [Mesorhabditis belari]|uniref:Cytochrome c oxidase assembly protein COX15 n=1 Tax=Mesorhabditis belari TaxID=2138241 RepID=A0AAF3J469_9BILA
MLIGRVGCALFRLHNVSSFRQQIVSKSRISFRAGNSGILSEIKLNILSRFNNLSTRVVTRNAKEEAQDKGIGWWLLGCAGMVYGAVALGGVTRLTESGLSMVNWDLFRTMKPPFNQTEWEAEFARYKEFPEYKFKSTTEEMTLNQFKFIWTMEYLHRMWGRAIGLAFFIPAAYFASRGRFTMTAMKIRMFACGGLLLAQGGVGWWMVKSGLDPSLNSDTSVPRVSQYRLATHLTLAFVLYSLFLWNGLRQVLTTPITITSVPRIGKLKALTHTSKGFMFATAIMGAFVAGLDAGLVYNSWPKFANDWIPPNLLARAPKWKNFFENDVTVQFIHRNLAYLTLVSITLTWLCGRRMGLTKRARWALNASMGMVYVQAALGITTLLNYVPVWLAALHQSGSMALISFVLWLGTELKRIPK